MGRQGYKKRVWKTTKSTKTVAMDGRYEFHGTGRDLYKAILKAVNIVPKGFIDVSAEEFLKHPERYSFEGEWVDRVISS